MNSNPELKPISQDSIDAQIRTLSKEIIKLNSTVASQDKRIRGLENMIYNDGK